eukprot:TRINITY_DN4954_c0_g1_i1.p1 TRINITY_DN4954_c0_g1~~TRINITY_DN4954_c0_g1_i1.p1  ORF type:complete len:667 (+),score=176.02 TRINITY_DN4954_c0_g1_i1:114-2114(+)
MARSTTEIGLLLVVIIVLGFNIMHSFKSTNEVALSANPKAKAHRQKQYAPSLEIEQPANELNDDDDGDDEADVVAEVRKAHVHANRQRKAPVSDDQSFDRHRRPVSPRAAEPRKKDSHSLLNDMLHLGGDKTERMFQTQNQTHIYMLSQAHNGRQLCFHRSQMDQVLLENCNQDWRSIQEFFATSSGHIGVKDIDGDSCMTVDPEQSLHLYPCHEDDPAQQWELEPGVGMVSKLNRLCATHIPGVMHMKMEKCNKPKLQAIIEVDKDYKPLKPDDWLLKLARQRELRLVEARAEIQDALRRVEQAYAHPVKPGKRRVVVFYSEAKLTELFAQLQWWISSWQRIKLNEASQRFDIFVLGDLPLYAKLKRKYPFCELRQWSSTSDPPSDDSPGVCWFLEYVGVSVRDPKRYDGWFNSIEILVNPKIRPLLYKYKQVMRADIDTFPTPRLRDYYIDHVYMASSAGYSNRYSRTKLARAAENAGLQYKGIFNIASTYYGPAPLVTAIADLTIACGHFAKAYLFAPGTPCKLPENLRPKHVKCGWPKGLHEGVLLLYSQELAVNHLYAIGKPIVLHQWATMDVPTIEPHPTCMARMLHVYHGSDRFSKFAFYADKYRNLDMADYDLRKIRDYVTWMALDAVDQGINREQPLQKVGGDLSKLCDHDPPMANP